MMIEPETLVCLVCEVQIQHSEYLYELFIVQQEDIDAYQFATWITHYRHRHSNYEFVINYTRPYNEEEYQSIKDYFNSIAKKNILEKIYQSDYEKDKKIKLIRSYFKLKVQDEESSKLAYQYLDALEGYRTIPSLLEEFFLGENKI